MQRTHRRFEISNLKFEIRNALREFDINHEEKGANELSTKSHETTLNEFFSSCRARVMRVDNSLFRLSLSYIELALLYSSLCNLCVLSDLLPSLFLP